MEQRPIVSHAVSFVVVGFVRLVGSSPGRSGFGHFRLGQIDSIGHGQPENWNNGLELAILGRGPKKKISYLAAW